MDQCVVYKKIPSDKKKDDYPFQCQGMALLIQVKGMVKIFLVACVVWAETICKGRNALTVYILLQ